uniref:Ig-like domain-containing protein n=1 Tax=Zosterops lateralis melanops TaxID=1220523 RepID=A0A8D2PZ48_ZOSLA
GAPSVTGPLCPPDWLVLQVPAQLLLEGDTVTLRCRGWWNRSVTDLQFYCGDEESRPLSFTWHWGGSGAPLGTGPHLELWHTGDNDSGHYHCRVSNGESVDESVPLNVTVLDWLVLQVPAQPLLEGDTVTLRCRGWWDMSVTGVRFYHGNEDLRRSPNRTELSLSPLQLHHSGQYRCRGWLKIGESWQWQQLAPVTVTVHGEPHPHSLPGSPAWGHSASSGDPQACLQTPITAQAPHPCSGSLIHFWVYHQIPQPYVGTPIFPVNFFYVPPSLLESPSLSPHPSMGHFARAWVNPTPL